MSHAIYHLKECPSSKPKLARFDVCTCKEIIEAQRPKYMYWKNIFGKLFIQKLF